MFTLQKPRFLVLYDHYEEINGGPSSGGLPEGDNYQSGRIAFYGVTLGYKKRFSDVWAVELFAGLGLSQSKYRGHQNIDNQYVSSDINFNGSGEVLLYRGGVMISYTFGQQSNKNTDGL
jgi:hypothetical protein